MMRTARTTRTIATHSSSRAAGRSLTVPPPGTAEEPGSGVPAGLAAGEAPGLGDVPGCRPSDTISEGDPGAMLLSSASNRSTANRTGAFGFTGGAVGIGVAEAPGASVAGGAADPVAGAAVGAAVGVGRTPEGPAVGAGKMALAE